VCVCVCVSGTALQRNVCVNQKGFVSLRAVWSWDSRKYLHYASRQLTKFDPMKTDYRSRSLSLPLPATIIALVFSEVKS